MVNPKHQSIPVLSYSKLSSGLIGSDMVAAGDFQQLQKIFFHAALSLSNNTVDAVADKEDEWVPRTPWFS